MSFRATCIVQSTSIVTLQIQMLSVVITPTCNIQVLDVIFDCWLFLQVTELLKQASQDNRVKGLIASFGPDQSFSGLAQVQELRNAVCQFR